MGQRLNHAETEGKHGNRLTWCHLQKSLNYRFLRTVWKKLLQSGGGAPDRLARICQVHASLGMRTCEAWQSASGIMRNHENIIYIYIRYPFLYEILYPHAPVSCSTYSANSTCTSMYSMFAFRFHFTFFWSLQMWRVKTNSFTSLDTRHTGSNEQRCGLTHTTCPQSPKACEISMIFLLTHFIWLENGTDWVATASFYPMT